MRLAYLDAFAGVSGDMLLGACVHAGVPVDPLHRALQELNLGATLQVAKVERSGIVSTKVDIRSGDHAAEVHEHEHAHAHDHPHDHGAHQHQHDHTHAHEGRSLAAIRQLIGTAALSQPVRDFALRAFELLGAAEAKIHDVPLDTIHFHEVGSVDAIADIVLAAVCVEALQIDAWMCSPLNLGGGTVQCAHGRFPVPAPATAELLRGAPTYSSGLQLELVTPTGAALIRALGCTFGSQPPMAIDALGYGAGTRNPPGFANVLRLSLGQQAGPAASTETVLVMETALDDLNPQVLAYVTEQALALGALDVMCTPVFMKKNRPGTLLTLLADHAHAPALENLLLRETSTLGFRVREERRVCLQRRHVQVVTAWGPVRLKVGHRGDSIFNVAPEFEDCRLLAETSQVPVKRVIEAALQAYRKENA